MKNVLGYSSVVEHLPSCVRHLSLILSIEKKEIKFGEVLGSGHELKVFHCRNNGTKCHRTLFAGYYFAVSRKFCFVTAILGAKGTR